MSTPRSSKRRKTAGQRRMPEKRVQAAIVRALRQLRADVYVLGTVRRRGDHPGTMQTPGLPDLLAFVPLPIQGQRRMVWIEVKAPGGRMSLSQRAFQGQCRLSGVDHIVGGMDEVIAWLDEVGVVRR